MAGDLFKTKWDDGASTFADEADERRRKRARVGPTHLADVQWWTFEGGVTKPSKGTLTFGQSLSPGTKAWFIACWFNPPNQSGPATDPVSLLIQFGGLSKGTIRADQTGALKAT